MTPSNYISLLALTAVAWFAFLNQWNRALRATAPTRERRTHATLAWAFSVPALGFPAAFCFAALLRPNNTTSGHIISLAVGLVLLTGWIGAVTGLLRYARDNTFARLWKRLRSQENDLPPTS